MFLFLIILICSWLLAKILSMGIAQMVSKRFPGLKKSGFQIDVIRQKNRAFFRWYALLLVIDLILWLVPILSVGLCHCGSLFVTLEL